MCATCLQTKISHRFKNILPLGIDQNCFDSHIKLDGEPMSALVNLLFGSLSGLLFLVLYIELLETLLLTVTDDGEPFDIFVELPVLKPSAEVLL